MSTQYLSVQRTYLTGYMTDATVRSVSAPYPSGQSSPAAENFRRELRRLDLTITQAAERFAVDERQIRRWTEGKHNPRLATLQRWADVFGRSAVWFLEDHTDTGERRRADDLDTNGAAA